ncbi:MAG TPA: ABC transporter permease, partial [Pseudomonas sp.]|nr:ABC transporter permease [Pseudomonas sp.]
MNPHYLASRLARLALPGLPTVLSIISSFALFVLFLAFQGKPAFEAVSLVFEGAFGSSFAWESTLQRAAPLMLTALCVALPARAGLIIIGGEGALVLGGLAAAT